MKLEKLQRIHKNKTKNRVGRGIAGKGGKSAGRGTKGQKARTGFNIPNRFEGGQTPLILRSPKVKGFKSKRIRPTIISWKVLEQKFADGAVITPKILREKQLIDEDIKFVKILSSDKPTKKFKIMGCHYSKSVAKNLKSNDRTNS